MFKWNTTAFSKIDSKIRNVAANAMRRFLPTPVPSTRKLLDQLKDFSTAKLLQHAADSSHSLFHSRLPGQALDTRPDETAAIDAESALITLFRDDVDLHPILSEHLKMLNEILGAIEDTHVNLTEHLSYTDFKEKVTNSINEYVAACKSWFEDQKFTSKDDFLTRRHHREIWYNSTFLPDSRKTADNQDHPQRQEHKDMITSIIEAISHNQVPDVIALHLLIPSLASAGYDWFGNAAFPTYLNFMPYNWIMDNRDDIWEKRMANRFDNEDDFFDPNQLDDSELVAFETTEFQDLNQFQFPTDGSKTPDPNAQGRPPMDESSSTSNRRKEKRRKEQKDKDDARKEKEKDAQQQSSGSNSNSNQQPPIPDDASYVPDPNWTRKEKGIISYVQSLPTMDMRRDHMTRFGTTNEQPTSINKSGVDPKGKGDIDVFFGLTKFSQHYLITFTRKSRKPIFNPIN